MTKQDQPNHDAVRAQLDAATAQIDKLVNENVELGRRLVDLDKSRARYKGLLENANSIILRIDPEGHITFFNQFAEQFFGFSREELIGRSIIGSIVPETDSIGTDLKALMLDTLRNPQHYTSNENENLLKNGNRVWISWSNKVILDEESGQVEILSIGTDITRRKAAEEALQEARAELEKRVESRSRDLKKANELLQKELKVREHAERAAQQSEERLYTILNSIPFRIRQVDTKLHIIWANKTAQDTDENICGQPCHRVYTGSETPCVACPAIKALKTGKTHTSTVIQPDRLTGADSYWEETGIPVYNDDGELDSIIEIGRDVTERMRAEQNLKDSEEKYRRLVEDLGGRCTIFAHKPNGEVTFVSKGTDEMFGYPISDLVGKKIQEAIKWTPESLEQAQESVLRAIKDNSMVSSEMAYTHPDGSHRTLEAISHPVFDGEGKLISIEGVAFDLSRRKRMEESLRKMATTDALTGISNRRRFLRRGQEELNRCKRYGSRVSFLMLDIDHFKRINDTYGHEAGDDVLRELASKCNEILRETDLFGRVGGEEFAILLVETSPETAVHIAQRIRIALENLTVFAAGSEIRFTVSIGLAPLGDTKASFKELMKRADVALYEAKNQGRNRVVCYSEPS